MDDNTQNNQNPAVPTTTPVEPTRAPIPAQTPTPEVEVTPTPEAAPTENTGEFNIPGSTAEPTVSEPEPPEENALKIDIPLESEEQIGAIKEPMTARTKYLIAGLVAAIIIVGALIVYTLMGGFKSDNTTIEVTEELPAAIKVIEQPITEEPITEEPEIEEEPESEEEPEDTGRVLR